MQGKQKCRILKEIRQRIADENDIPFVTQECRHQGNCSGTCPRCESELRYLEQQLAQRAAGSPSAAESRCCMLPLSEASGEYARQNGISARKPVWQLPGSASGRQRKQLIIFWWTARI